MRENADRSRTAREVVVASLIGAGGAIFLTYFFRPERGMLSITLLASLISVGLIGLTLRKLKKMGASEKVCLSVIIPFISWALSNLLITGTVSLEHPAGMQNLLTDLPSLLALSLLVPYFICFGFVQSASIWIGLWRNRANLAI